MDNNSITEDDPRWGLAEYNYKNSVRLMNNNPDMVSLNIVSCACGREINQAEDWHVMIANGTLLCKSCATCSSCNKCSSSANGKLVCIHGLVLCYSCIETFGYPLEPKVRIRIVPNAELKSKASHNANSSNNLPTDEDVLAASRRTNRCQYSPKEDNRRPLRIIDYEPPSVQLPDEFNPYIVPKKYEARPETMEKMTCPGCLHVAKGPSKYVVPALARVYHRACFVCFSCKEPLSTGLQVAGKHFESCTCEPPVVWCTHTDCKQNRLDHHGSGSCRLGAVRPGGREQRDVTSAPLLRGNDNKANKDNKANNDNKDNKANNDNKDNKANKDDNKASAKTQRTSVVSNGKVVDATNDQMESM